MRGKEILLTVGMCIMALAIPGLLILDAAQARRYAALQKEVTDLERKQEELVTANNQLITDISLLSRSDRIEKIAQEELGMRPAESEEIDRMKIQNNKLVKQEEEDDSNPDIEN